MSTMGERIRQSREKKGILQSHLAKMIGVKSSGVISNWENDINKPDADKMVALCEALSISLSFLLNYYGPEKAPTPRDGGGLDEEQRELVRLFEAAPASLRTAALAVLKSAEGQDKAPGGASKAE